MEATVETGPAKTGPAGPLATAMKREEKYAVIEKECLAVVWALKVFHTYLYSKRFSIEMNHKPLALLQKAKATTSRLTRWALTVQEYDFFIKYHTSAENQNADSLSKGPPREFIPVDDESESRSESSPIN